MMAQNLNFHKLLIDSQSAYLNALHRLSNHDPSLCSQLFDLDDCFCKESALISEVDIHEFCTNINHWVLSPIKCKSGKSLNPCSLFDDWVALICDELDSDSRANLKFNYPENISIIDKDIIDDVLYAQTSLLLAIGDCAFNSLGLTVAIIGVDNQVLSRLKRSWFVTGKMKSLRSLKPILTLNKKIDSLSFLKFGREGLLAIETGLYSIS